MDEQKIQAEMLQARLQMLLEEVESWQETLEILNDEETMIAFRQGVEDIKAGRIVPWEDVQRELGLA